MTVAGSDSPGPISPALTSQLNSGPDKGTKSDSGEKEKDAVTWKRQADAER